MSKEPKYFQDCDNCKFVCKIDGICNYDMFPGYEEGQLLYCEIKEENKQ